MPAAGGNLELQLVIKALDQASKVLKQVQGEVGNTEKVTETMTKRSVSGWGKVNQEMRRITGPINTIRTAVMRLRLAWFAFFGIAVGQVAKVGEEMRVLDQAARRMGTSFEDLSRKRFDYVFDKDALIKVADGWKQVGESIQFALKWYSELAAKAADKVEEKQVSWWQKLFKAGATTVVPGLPPQFADKIAALGKKGMDWVRGKTGFKEAAEGSKKTTQEIARASDNWVKIEEQRVDRIKKLTMSEYDYKKLQMDKYLQELRDAGATEKEIVEARNADLFSLDREHTQFVADNKAAIAKAEGNLTEALRIEYEQRMEMAKIYSAEDRKIVEERIKAETEVERLHMWGRKTNMEAMTQLVKDGMKQIDGYFADTLIDGLDNKFKNARELAYNFIVDLRNMIIRAAMEQLVTNMFKGLMGGGGGLMGFLGGGGGGMLASIGKAPLPFAEGGVVTKPTNALIGESGPEAVVPLDKMGGGDTYVYINAVDSASFTDMINRNPDAITSVVKKNISTNKYMRHTMKEGR